MSSSNVGGFSASSLARFRADATLRVDSATGQIRVTDRKNPFQRVVTWVRDALGLRSKDAVELEKNEIRGAYNRFFTSVADDLRYRKQTPALQEMLAPRIIGNNPKPLSVRMVRKILTDLEQSASPDAGPGHPPEPAASSDASAVTLREDSAADGTVATAAPAADREHGAPETPVRKPRSGSLPAGRIAHEDEAGQLESAADGTVATAAPAADREHGAPETPVRKPRSGSLPAGRSTHEDEAGQLEWDYEVQAVDPDNFLEEEFDQIIAGFPGREDDDMGGMETDGTVPDEESGLDPDAAMAEPDDTGPAMDPYQTVFIDDLDDVDDAAPDGERSVEAIVQQRLLAIAERMRDEKIAAADTKVINVMAQSGPEDYDSKVAEAREQRNALAATLEKQLHPGHIDVVDAGIEDVYAEIEQLEIEAMATDKETGEWQRLRGRFLRLEQELRELERLQQA